MKRIDTLYAFVATHHDGEEGIVGVHSNGSWMPLVCGDIRVVDRKMRALAAEVAEKSGLPVTLVKFTVRQELEVVGPKAGGRKQ